MKRKWLARVLLPVLLALLGWKAAGYVQASQLIADIRANQEISTRIGDGSTAPLFLRHVTDILQSTPPAIPLVEACHYRHVQAVETLLANGADPDRCISGHWSPVEAVLMNGPAGLPDERSVTILRMLLEAGADPDKSSGQELPPALYLAQLISVGNDDPVTEQLLRCLLEHGCAVTAQEHGEVQSILHYIAASGNAPLLTDLVQVCGLDVNDPKDDGETPLIYAIKVWVEWQEDPTADMVQLLLDLGADPNRSDDTGKTAADYAAEKGLTELLPLLQPMPRPHERRPA